MKTLSSPINTQIAATQSGWAEVYDFYLTTPITTPWGSVSTLRLTDLPGGVSFFTPKLDPEPAGTQGNAAAYQFWPLKRAVARSSAQFSDDKMTITASNVTTEWAAMINAIEWRGVPVAIRKISLSIVTPTADDCAPIFIGVIDTAAVTLNQLQFTCSNDLSSFNLMLPRENMHSNCRFSWGDDQCTAIKFLAANYKSKTGGASSTTTVVNSADLTEDSLASGATPTDIINALADAKITASSQSTGWEGYRVRTAYEAGGTYWQMATLNGTGEWGTLTQGYWQIPDAQAGIANPALTPSLTFDFTTAKTPKLWQIRAPIGIERSLIFKNLLFFSSTNNSTWKFERHFSMPPIAGGVYFDTLIHGAATARYWRICIRNIWGDTYNWFMIDKVRAYEGNKHYWRNGIITFAANTSTVALRNVSRLIRESYSGSLVCAALPVAPANGDTFTIQRGCGRTFNDCAERLNTENFGGFDTIANATQAR